MALGLSGIISRLAASIVGAASIIALAVLMTVYDPPARQLVSALLFTVGPAATTLV